MYPITSGLVVFFLTAMISFSASLQANPVTLGVVRAAKHKSYAAAISKALGGTLAEILYAALAILLAEFLYRRVGEWSPMAYIGPIVMVGFGVYLLVSANRKFIRGRRTVFEQSNSFVTGFSLGILNPQIFLFYSGLLLAFYQFGIKPESTVFRFAGFVSGAAFGFFMLLSLIIYIIKKRGGLSPQFSGSRIMYFCGLILITVGAYQLFMALKSI
jgi:threonine/homoserine/homoserine lactone efflux protein